MDSIHVLATIAVEGGRADVYAEQEPATYNADLVDAEDNEYVIYVRLPDGTTEQPAIAPQRTMDDVLVAIHESWGIGDWDLRLCDEDAP